MQGPNTTAPGVPGPAGMRYRDQPEGEADEERDDATLSADRELDVSADEDAGSDPYNRTGRFERNVR